MSDEATLVELLRSSAVTNGTISLCRINGSAWRATICHHKAAGHPLEHMIHPLDDWKDDPVQALRIALIEDERQCRDLERRYAAAPKLGVPATADPMEDLLG